MSDIATYLKNGENFLKYGDSLLYIDETVGNIVSFGDGIWYRTVTIGNQTWLAENLVMNIPTYSQLVVPEDATNCIGRMYQEYAVSAINAAVSRYGWKVPSQDDFRTLCQFVLANGKRMATALMAESWGGTDDYGFSIVQSHFIHPTASLEEANYWTTDEHQRFWVRSGGTYGFEQRDASEWNNIRLILDN